MPDLLLLCYKKSVGHSFSQPQVNNEPEGMPTEPRELAAT